MAKLFLIKKRKTNIKCIQRFSRKSFELRMKIDVEIWNHEEPIANPDIFTRVHDCNNSQKENINFTLIEKKKKFILQSQIQEFLTLSCRLVPVSGSLSIRMKRKNKHNITNPFTLYVANLIIQPKTPINLALPWMKKICFSYIWK